MKPNPPEQLSLQAIDSNTLKLYYDIPHELSHFPPGLVSSIRYKSEFAVGGEWKQVDTATFPKNNTNFTVLLEDLTPHAMYTVQVRLRSAWVSSLTNPQMSQCLKCPSAVYLYKLHVEVNQMYRI